MGNEIVINKAIYSLSIWDMTKPILRLYDHVEYITG